MRHGLRQGEYCLFTTQRPISDVTRGMKVVGVSTEDRVPDWIASSGATTKLDVRDTAAISFSIKQSAHVKKKKKDVSGHGCNVAYACPKSFGIHAQLPDLSCFPNLTARFGQFRPSQGRDAFDQGAYTMEQLFDGVNRNATV